MADFCSKEFSITVGQLGLGSFGVRGFCQGIPIVAGEAVAHLFTGPEAVPPYTWYIDSGEAELTAAALTLEVGVDDGEGGELMQIVGTPTLTGPITFTVRVEDEEVPPNSATATYTIHVAEITDTAGALPPAAIGQAYTHDLSQNGAPSPEQWSVTDNLSGFLAAGFSLNPATGVISGTPPSAGETTFTVTLSSANI